MSFKTLWGTAVYKHKQHQWPLHSSNYIVICDSKTSKSASLLVSRALEAYPKKDMSANSG